MIMRKRGVDDERFEDFISELWHLYIKTGLNPEPLKKQVDELYYFQSQNNSLGTAVSIFYICDNINNLKSEEATLDNGVAGLKSKKERVRKRQFRTVSPES
jgi:hypothetical protein